VDPARHCTVAVFVARMVLPLANRRTQDAGVVGIEKGTAALTSRCAGTLWEATDTSEFFLIRLHVRSVHFHADGLSDQID
jgi:hypothetical protein